MWKYEKKLEYPVNIKSKDLKMAKNLMAQYGGPASELSAFITYMSQRYTMPDDRGRALLTDIATEEMAHLEIIATMISQIMKNANVKDIKKEGIDSYYSQFDKSIFPGGSLGDAWSANFVDMTGDFIADIESDMAAEQRARATYEHLLDLTDENDIIAPLEFLRQREIIHYQRFKELRNYYLKIKK